MKRCSKCGEVLDEEQFAKDRSSPDGLQRACRSCHQKYRKELRRRKQVEGKKRKTHTVDALLVTRAICPECGCIVRHVVKADAPLERVLEEVRKLKGDFPDTAVRPHQRPDPNTRSPKQIEKDHFGDPGPTI